MTKTQAAANATKIRVKRANSKMQSAYFLMQMENKEITYSSLSREAGVSRPAATKWLKNLKSKKQP
jgi:Mn-dependent DtxR family transcriptional regulator